MPEFCCRVGAPNGAIAERYVSAVSAVAAREQLAADGLEIFDVIAGSASSAVPALRKLAAIQLTGASVDPGRRLFRRRRTHVVPAELLLLSQELAALVNAGLPLLRCVDILRTRRAGSVVGSMLDRVRGLLAGGEGISGAFRPEIERVRLPELFVTSLQVGEASGDLVTAIRRYTAHLDKSLRLRGRVRAAMMYPLVLAAVSLAVVLILLVMVIPQFAEFYASSGAELPFTTRALVGVAGLVSRYGLLLAAGAMVGFFFLRRWAQTPAGRATVDDLKLRLPVVGPLRLRYFGLEMARTLATLLSGGAPLVSALRVTAEGTSNRAFRTRLVRVSELVTQGTSLHAAFETYGLLEPLGLEMVQVGESTGALEEMLEHVATTYDDVLDRQVTTAVSLMEPAMLVGMGLLVAGILMSLYLPLFQTVQVVG
ncbi:MAG TPA: type II secretion system F family protein [Acidobacteriota bacterium]|nr:type II secretion system F family protein [Acidobacteriota bacterium]